MQSLCLIVCRFSTAAWVGAAVLFVVTSVAEQSAFDSYVRDQLAVLRFPYYYGFGFSLVGAGFLAGLGARHHPAVAGKTAAIFLVCMFAALTLMLVDYFWIYRPLVGLITPAGTVRSAEFDTYHKASMYINLADVGLCLAAALVISRPGGGMRDER